MKNNTEVEVKFSLNETDIFRIKKFTSSLYMLGKKQILHMSAYYYDTTDMFLFKHNLTYRVRRENNNYIATIKGKNNSNTFLTDRLEINHKVSSITPDISPFINNFPTMADTLLLKTFQPIVTNNFCRQKSILFFNGTKIELAIDIGFIYAADKQLPICELELELKKGYKKDLISLTELIKAKLGLKISKESKFYRGIKIIRKSFNY
ncbi:CYTH domain-containing protein [Pectinatus sottacetonis]|uniref:CYTH domain-containing protein n=1 Tax=Pectinatus sottacetonis TaxID=1002795 RepID=UPI0018C82F31|nr:CYTH domain-containing protein [Pectinatus sottacetonis]